MLSVLILLALFHKLGNTVNNKRLTGLKFGESANIFVWQKKGYQIYPKIAKMYGY